MDMSELFLDSLEIQGFRAFRHLKIEKLGRVNLIVGKNNVGKTCVLEALRVYARRSSTDVLRSILDSRDEIRYVGRVSDGALAFENESNSVEHLFYGRGELKQNVGTIFVGPCGVNDKTLTLNIEWFLRETDENGGIQLSLIEFDEQENIEGISPYIVVRLGDQIIARFRVAVLERRAVGATISRTETLAIRHCFVGAGGLGRDEVSELWDQSLLSNLDDTAVQALSLIAPNNQIERISFVGEGRTRRTAMVKLKESNRYVPLRSMGEGMNRMLGIALALANARSGLLLIDEIETGLHYSVQADMWRLIFETAERLNVQVFATTHSYDCVRAFEKVALQHPEEGVIVRLYRDKNGDVKQTLYDEEDLQVVVEQDIEVR